MGNIPLELHDGFVFMSKPSCPLLIGIGGCSRSGKTSLALSLRQQLGAECAILSLDEFVLPEQLIPKIRGHTDWEIPESLDLHRFLSVIDNMIGEGYSMIIIEGLFIFSLPEIFYRLHVAIHLHIGRREFIKSKQLDLRWGKEPEWYIRYIWKAYRKRAFLCKRKWGEFPLVLKMKKEETLSSLPTLISLIQLFC